MAMAETLPEIREADAPPEIAAIYDEIRAATWLPLVNLIWRHLAALPGALPWSWGAVRPLARAGLIAAAAERVRDRLELPAVPPMTLEALAAVGVHGQSAHGGLPTIRRILDAYNRGNANNLVALTALLLALDGGAPAAEPTPEAGAPPAAAGALPPLPRLGDLDERTKAGVEALAAGHAGFETGAVPSLYLHLAHWPGFLEQARGRIEPLPIAELRERACALGRGEAAPLARRIEPGPPPPARDAAVEAMDRFSRGLIPEMLPVGLILARALPR